MAKDEKTILHADDVDSWRDYVKALLQDEYTIVEAVDDYDSIPSRLAKGGIDLLILDFLMPETPSRGNMPETLLQGGIIALCASHNVPVIVFTGVLIDAKMTREDFEIQVAAPVVLKNDPDLDTKLRKLVEECLRRES